MDSDTTTTEEAMTTQTRHGKATANPAEYTYLGCFYQGASDNLMAAYDQDHVALEGSLEAIGSRWEDVGATGGHFYQSGRCDACGTNFAHGVLFHHLPTNEVVAIGHMCANFFDSTDRWTGIRNMAERRAQKAQERAENQEWNFAQYSDELWTLAGLLGQVELDVLNTDAYDILNTAVTGQRKMSSRAIAYAVKNATWMVQDQERKAQRAVELADAPNLEAGKQVITGTIQSWKYKDNGFGIVPKMTVKMEDGNQVWGTLPQKFIDLALEAFGKDWDTKILGCEVTFTAEVQLSNEDLHFGFFKRPSKVQITL